MRIKLILTAIAVTAIAAIAFSGIASAHHRGVKTRVSIQAESDGFFGYVKSKKVSCENNRKIAVFKQSGRKPNVRFDQKMFTDTSSASGDRYQWDTGNSGYFPGSFYAHAFRKGHCRPANSRTVRMPVPEM